MTTDAHDLLDAVQEHESDWTIAWLIAHADPELWAPRQFIIVDELTKGSPTLAATWRAIYRLWVFYRPSGRFRFGLRMIADVGGVGRGHLSGASGAIRKLVELGLITVTGMDANPRDDAVRSDRWAYSIDPAHLESLSIRLIRSRITAGLRVAPRRPPEAQQRDLFAALDMAPAAAMLDLVGAEDVAQPFLEIPGAAPLGASVAAYRHSSVPSASAAPAGASVLGRLAPLGATAQIELAPAGASVLGRPAPLGATAQIELAPVGATFTPVDTNCAVMWHPAEPVAPVGAAFTPGLAPASADRHPTVPEMAPTGATFFPVDGEGWRDGSIERKRESVPHTPAPMISLSEIEQLIERTLARQFAHLNAGPPPQAAPPPEPRDSRIRDLIPTTVPPAPPGEPVLSLPLLTIWETINQLRTVPDSDLVQIKMLIERYREITDGHSTYWLGRVMLFADMCRNDQEPIKIKLINSYMYRMRGVGYSTETLEDRTIKAEKGATESDRAERRSRPAASNQSAPAESVTHPAIAAYIAAFGKTPNDVQITQMVETVTDNAAWQRVLTDWQANGWQPGGVAKMLDRYHKETVGITSETSVSIRWIYGHPDLTCDERADWIRRFHAAPTAAEQRNVVIRLIQDRPTTEDALLV